MQIMKKMEVLNEELVDEGSADPQLTAVLLQFVGPDLDGFIQHLAQVGRSGIAGLSVSHCGLVVSEGLLNDVQSGVQLGQLVGAGGQLLRG